jgi:hypothetical protein
MGVARRRGAKKAKVVLALRLARARRLGNRRIFVEAIGTV